MHKTRFIWLKNPWNLTERQAHRLGELERLNLKINRAYLLKELFRHFWEYHRRCMPALWRRPHRRRLPRPRGRTLIDIVFEKVVRHADAQIKHCARCHAETRACFPHQMPGPLQYGPGQSLRRAPAHRADACSNASPNRCTPSSGAPSPRPRSSATCATPSRAGPMGANAIERLASPAMHVDETSLRVDRKNHWIHVYNGTLTVKCLHAKGARRLRPSASSRATAVWRCTMLGLVSELPHCDHALCERASIANSPSSSTHGCLGQAMKPLLGACHQVSKRDDKTLSAYEYVLRTLSGPHPRRERASTHPTSPKRPARQSGSPTQSVGAVQKHRFAKTPNNRAERDLNDRQALVSSNLRKPIAETQEMCSSELRVQPAGYSDPLKN